MGEYSVYIHKNKVNNMRYVGVTSQDVTVRWQGGNGYRKQSHFWRAIQKYGWNGFDHIVVADGLTAEEAFRMETELIAKYKTTNNRYGYNKSIGGESGAKGVEHSEKNRAACSAALKKLWSDVEYRASHSERTIAMNKSEGMRKLRSESNHNRIVSAETKKKISENRKGKGRVKRTPEQIERMKASHSGGAEKVPVICIETGATYGCINDASRATGINKKQISGCCRCVPHYNTAGGYHWKYA